MDFTASCPFRGYDLNSYSESLVGGQTVPVGCVIETLDPSQLEIRQFTEPLALEDGIDFGGTWLGGRHVRMTGAVYGSTHADAISRLLGLAAVMTAESGTFGYYPLAIPGFGTISVRPNGLRYQFDRKQHGGDTSKPLAVSWSVTFYAANPAIV
jgi:hypothetical protein